MNSSLRKITCDLSISGQKREKIIESLESDFSPSQVIWRYINFAKFIDLIMDKKLFFNRVDKYIDPFEGVLPKTLAQEFEEEFKKSIQASINLPYNKPQANVAEISKKTLFDSIRTHTFVNCWHMNNSESDAMWNIFCVNKEGLAIKSTIQSLKESLESYKEGDIYFSKIYYGEDRPEIEFNYIYPFLCKRVNFEHEKEFRVIISKYNIDHSLSQSAQVLDNGIVVDVDIQKLVHEIKIHPFAEDWFVGLINKVTQKFNLEVNVSKSELYTSPWFFS